MFHNRADHILLRGRWQLRALRGADALEQRPDSVPTFVSGNAQQTLNMAEKEAQMTESNNSEAPRWCLHRRNAFLAALHVLVLVVSLAAHPPFVLGADRALP